MIMVMIFYFGSFGWDVMHGSNTRREQRQRNTQRELDREREREEISKITVIRGEWFGLQRASGK